MRITRSSAIFAFVAASVLFIQYQTFARNDTEMAVMLSRKLNELKMFDYSEMAIREELDKNPADADLLKIQLAMTYAAQNKSDDANKIIAQIPSTSEYYPNSRMALGIELAKKGKNDMAAAALEEYFKVYLAKPPTTDSGKDEFRMAAGYLVYVYKQLNKPTEAEKVVAKYMPVLNPEAGKDNDQTDDFLMQVQVRLDGIAEMVDSNKEGWKDLCNKTLKEIDDKLMWLDQTPVRALGLCEKARAYLYLGRLDDAYKTLSDKNNSNLMAAFDEGYAQEGQADLAPSVYQAYWLGKVCLAKAEKAAEGDKVAIYSEAMQKFYKILMKHEKFPKYDDSLTGFLICKEELEKRGKKPQIPKALADKLLKVSRSKGTGTPTLERREADQLLQDEKFQSAIPLYTKAIINGNRKSWDADYLLARLAYCYIRSDQLLEAMAVIGYLGDYFPTSEHTPMLFLQTGEMLWKKSQFEEAIMIYKTYLKNSPTHEYAGDISARVAKYWFDKATALAKEANALPQGEEKAQKAKDAKAAYLDTVPFYKNIVTNFMHTRYGISSYYMMGYCYMYGDEYLKAAEAFTKYCDKELAKEGDKDIGGLADGKVRIADNYVQCASELEKEADALKNKAAEAEASAAAAAPAAAAPAKDKKEPAKDAKDDKEKTDEAADKDKPAEEAMTPVQMNAKAEELSKKAQGYFKDALKNLLELTGTWCAAGGIFENTKDPKALKAIETGYSLMGWTYDGLGDKENACKSFDFFIKKYPQAKMVPGSMFRLGKIYGDMNKYDIAGQVLENLADKFPNTNEGKQALPSLAKNMYEVKNYEKCIAVLKKIFDQNFELSISDLRWVLSNLSDCGGNHIKNGAEMAQKAGDILLTKIDKPDYKEWLGIQKMREIGGNPKEVQRIMQLIKDKLFLDYANAAYWAGSYDKGIAKLDVILANEKTPYYYDGRFLRAMCNRGLKKFDKTLEDYSDISMMAIGAKKYSIYNKVQCKLGDTYIEMKDTNPAKAKDMLKKALSSYNIVAIADLDDDQSSKLSKDEIKEQRDWVEYAIYMMASTSSRLGADFDKDKREMVEKYKKYFPTGKYIKDIDNLPPAETFAAAPAPVADKNK